MTMTSRYVATAATGHANQARGGLYPLGRSLRAYLFILVLAMTGDCSAPSGSITIGPTGGKITMSLGEGAGSFTAEIPPDATDRQLRLSAHLADTFIPGAASRIVELGPSGTTFRNPVTLRFAPKPGDLVGAIAPSQVRVATYVDGRWAPLPTTFAAPGVIAATTTHFSPFALVASCQVAGIGTDFPLTGCPAFNPRIQTSVPVRLDATAGLITVRLLFTASTASTATLVTVSGLQSSRTYFLARDGARLATPLPADATGTVRFTQDLTADHLVVITTRSGTVELSPSTCVLHVQSL